MVELESNRESQRKLKFKTFIGHYGHGGHIHLILALGKGRQENCHLRDCLKYTEKLSQKGEKRDEKRKGIELNECQNMIYQNMQGI
jgi:hypothetical protein